MKTCSKDKKVEKVNSNKGGGIIIGELMCYCSPKLRKGAWTGLTNTMENQVYAQCWMGRMAQKGESLCLPGSIAAYC
jgi:hypothetical protein